ncbi:MAG: nucleotidyltransferase [Syntrophomonas sp.]
MSQKHGNLTDRFKDFITNLNIANQTSIHDRYKNITKDFNLRYWKLKSDLRNVHFIGSYGRGTAIKGVKNINLLAVLPPDMYRKYDGIKDNGQKILLEEIRDFLIKSHPEANINTEGHLIIPFPDQLFEFIPSFLSPKKSYIYPDIHNGGSWVSFNPIREIEVIDESNYKYNGKIKHLAKMMRAWKLAHNVPISGMLLDTLVLNFMDEWEDNNKSYAVYAFMIQDFLEYLASRRKDQLHWYAKGSNRQLPGEEDFGAKANVSYKKCLKALQYEYNEEIYEANNCWKEIFGSDFPG